MKIYLVLAGAVALIGLGLFLMEIGRDPRPPVPCSLVVHWDNPQDRDRCLAREAEVDHLTAVLREMREENARIAACDHRSWFGLVGKNECQP